jgi:hypothetical protein
MHEARKLAEAEYFLGRMAALQNTREEFVWNLSAFLTAARTVAQYACEEATPKPKGQGWYDAAVAAHPSIKFFRGKRNVNIHTEPVEPQTAIGVELVESVGLGEALSIQIFEEGELVGERRVETPAQPTESPPPVVRLHYRFADWPGSDDVITLCRIYLDALKALVADGQAKGFLS